MFGVLPFEDQCCHVLRTIGFMCQPLGSLLAHVLCIGSFLPGLFGGHVQHMCFTKEPEEKQEAQARVSKPECPGAP